jgi:hypothetical protein
MVWYSDARLLALKWSHFGLVIKWLDHFWRPSCFRSFENLMILSGFQMVTISLVGRFILTGIQMVGYLMTVF